MIQQVPTVAVAPYYYVPVVTMVPVVPQFLPVTSYQNILVERRYCCFFKKIEVVSVPQTFLVPIKY